MSTAERSAKINSPLKEGEAISCSQAAPAFAQEIAHKTEMVGKMLVGLTFGKSHPGQGVYAVHECRIIAHFPWHRTQKVPDLLLLLDVDIEVAETMTDASIGPNLILAAAELS